MDIIMIIRNQLKYFHSKGLNFPIQLWFSFLHDVKNVLLVSLTIRSVSSFYVPSPRLMAIFACHWMSCSLVSKAKTTVTSSQRMAIVLDSLSRVNPETNIHITYMMSIRNHYLTTSYILVSKYKKFYYSCFCSPCVWLLDDESMARVEG